MADGSNIPSIRGAIVTEVTLVDRVERPEEGAFRSESLPGHLIHVCTEGQVEQRAGGVVQRFGAGDSVWYYENETVQGELLQAPWEFYTVNFHAPSLPPPQLKDRVQKVEKRTVELMEQMLRMWRAVDMPALLRHLRIHALLLEIISSLLPPESQNHRVDDPALLWWEIEDALRSRLDEPIDLALLAKISGRSQRSIARACRLATGMPPIKRVKQIRLGYARGLTKLSDLSMTEIAMRIGYTRVQEFSRDFHAFFGCTPSEDRQSGPDYRRRIVPDEEPS